MTTNKRIRISSTNGRFMFFDEERQRWIWAPQQNGEYTVFEEVYNPMFFPHSNGMPPHRNFNSFVDETIYKTTLPNPEPPIKCRGFLFPQENGTFLDIQGNKWIIENRTFTILPDE